jgi:hypothetical protein
MVRLSAILIVAAIVFPATAPAAKAAPTTDIWTDFYDCSMQWTGTKFRGCDSTGFNQGVTSGGYYKHIESCQCEGSSCTDTWYKWNGASWTMIAGEPNPPDC